MPCVSSRNLCRDTAYVSLVLFAQHIHLKAARDETTAVLCASSPRKQWCGVPAEDRTDLRSATTPAWPRSVEHADREENFHTSFEFA